MASTGLLIPRVRKCSERSPPICLMRGFPPGKTRGSVRQSAICTWQPTILPAPARNFGPRFWRRPRTRRASAAGSCCAWPRPRTPAASPMRRCARWPRLTWRPAVSTIRESAPALPRTWRGPWSTRANTGAAAASRSTPTVCSRIQTTTGPWVALRWCAGCAVRGWDRTPRRSSGCRTPPRPSAASTTATGWSPRSTTSVWSTRTCASGVKRPASSNRR